MSEVSNSQPDYYKVSVYALNKLGFSALQALADKYGWELRQDIPDGHPIDFEELQLESLAEGLGILTKRDPDTGFIVNLTDMVVPTPISIDRLGEEASHMLELENDIKTSVDHTS